jgi:hypothetical protein
MIRPLVYVHGAGPQSPAAELKAQVDTLLFGNACSASRMAYYADVRWPPEAGRSGLSLALSSQRARRRAVRAAAQPHVSARAAATAIVATSFAQGRSGRERRAGPAAQAAVPALPQDAVRLVERLYRNADRIARRSAAPRYSAGSSFPDPIFRLVVGWFAGDVIDYLFGGWAERMRAPVRRALQSGPPPEVILAHSLGTIVSYDVLTEPAFAGLDVKLLATVGCPLGIGNVQDRLRDGIGKPNPVPRPVKGWANFADRWDPVALDPTLRDAFEPPKDFASDEAVNNPAKNNHDLAGYLSVAIVRSTIVDATGTS